MQTISASLLGDAKTEETVLKQLVSSNVEIQLHGTNSFIANVKTLKVHPVTGHEGLEEKQRNSSTISLTSLLDRGGWLAPRPSRFTPVPIVQEAGWALGPVWTGVENHARTWIRSLIPDIKNAKPTLSFKQLQC
jgi:hypothetical protein